MEKLTENNYPLLSVIVPVYNTESYLKRCLNSIIHQTYTNLEIIIINDGSTDNSGEICQEYSNKDTRIKLYTQQNKGLPFALNIGITNASGEWVIFVDSDDWVELNSVEGLFEKVIKYPQVELIRSYNRQVNINNQIFTSEIIKDEILYSRDEFLASNKIGGFISSLFVKRKIITDSSLEFPVDLRIKSDLVFTFKCVLNCKWVLVYNRIFYNYLIRETSLTNTPTFEKKINHLDAAQKVYEYSLSYKNKIIRKAVRKYLNNGLDGFFSGISHLSIEERFSATPNEIRKIISRYLRINDLSFYKMTYKNIFYTIIVLFDFRILNILRKMLSYVKK